MALVDLPNQRSAALPGRTMFSTDDWPWRMKKTIKLYLVVVAIGGTVSLCCFARLYMYMYSNNSITIPNGNAVLSFSRTQSHVHSLPIPTEKDNIRNSSSKLKAASTFTPIVNFPKIENSQYRGTVLYSNNKKTELVSAFFDLRQGQHIIAILGCHDHRTSSQMHFYCLIQYSNGIEKCIPKETSKDLLSGGDENSSKHCWSYRFACEFGSGENLPTAVALSTSSTCDSPKSGWIDIYNSMYNGYKTGLSEIEKYTFGVCFQTPFYLAKNWKKEVLIEAIERYLNLGAEWFTVYYRENPSVEIMQVLSDYKMVEAINMTVSEATYYDIRYYGELLAIRDCVYRNMHRVQYLALTDIDEVFVPQGISHKNIPDMLSSIDSTGACAFQFKHVALMVDPKVEPSRTDFTCTKTGRQIPKPKFETNKYRTKPFPIPEAAGLGRWKVVVKPLDVDKIGIHSVYQCVSGFRQVSVPASTGLLYHYRNKPFIDPKRCKSCSIDNRLIELAPSLTNTYIEKACN